MSLADLKLSPQANFYIPGPDDTPVSLLNRWSNTCVSLPAAVAEPYTEADIAALIVYAKQRGLSVVAAGGKHFPAVPVTSQTLYVDLKNFASIKIDENASTVSVGGGASTGAVLEVVTAAGYFTAVPNTDAVGFVGAFLGGGSSGLNSVKGFMIDHVVNMRVVTAAGETLELGPQSEGEEEALWHAFRGAGHGLAVVTELTLQIYPLSELGMDDNKMWLRTLVFPPPAIGIASQLFSSLQATRGPISSNLVIARSPPESPMPDAPVIVVSASYFGPSVEAEKTLSCLFNADVLAATVVANTSFIPMNAMNSGTKAVEMRGGFKRSEATLLQDTVDATTIERTFTRFLQLGADAPDSMRSGVVFFAFDPSVLQSQGNSEAAKHAFFEARDTRCIVYHDIWFREESSASIIDSYLPQSIETVRANENGPMRRFANFMQHPANLTETYSEAKIVEKLRVKRVWDPENVFWTPGI